MWQMNAADTKARLYVEDDLAEGRTLHPSPDQQHYLVNVMRLGDGDAVALFNGRDGEWRAILQREGKRGCSLAPEAQTRQQHASPDLWLVFAPVKKARLDFIAQKASEMGCSRIWPVRTDYCQVSRVNDDRMLANAIEAAEQTERLDIAEIMPFSISRAAVVIGPEGGFSPAERSRIDGLQNSLKLSLGPRILRADTAAIAALTCYQSVCGDWT